MTATRIALAIAAATIAACLFETADATSNYTYKKNEYRVVHNGLAPNKRFSVAAHGEGELGYDDFHLYLMAEPGHRKIGPLEEIGPDILDTGADAYHAAWSADSRHVAVHYRLERHKVTMVLYRIEHGRAYSIAGPSLLRAVLKRETSDDEEERSDIIELTWLSPARFILSERALFKTGTTELADALGTFARPERQEPDRSEPKPWYSVRFSARAVCEFAPGNKYAVVEMKPGSFDE
jgi:hypothetical protein